MKTKLSQKPKTTVHKTRLGVKVNCLIFLTLGIFCLFVMPTLVFKLYFPEDNSPDYTHESFTYSSLYKICPCSEKEDYDYDSCAGYYACGPDKANLPYNFDNAPEELLKAANHDVYFENEISVLGHRITSIRTSLLMDLSHISESLA
ncbi:hypothetical protein IJ380_03515 [Candidatus Saccharibacteria bacterium]|nr:hypothetical protein [Candidatus Saccharibacteria bacterium]